MLFVELAAGLGQYAVRPLSPQTGGPLVEAGHTTRVIPFLHRKGAGLFLVESPVGGVVEVPEVTEGAFQPPPVVPILVLGERLDDFADEASEVVGSQALGGIGPLVCTEMNTIRGEDLVDVAGIPGVRPTELLGYAAVCFQDSVCVEHAGGGGDMLSDWDLM